MILIKSIYKLISQLNYMNKYNFISKIYINIYLNLMKTQPAKGGKKDDILSTLNKEKEVIKTSNV